jgi:glycosyltransferase involved in cell wall biosynthesis
MTRVSVITPCHEAAQFVDELLASVTAQTMRDWEHIVVDDGSPDDSAARVSRRLQGEPRLKLIRQPNAGAIAARNRGFAASDPRSKYVMFLDADDALLPDALQVLSGYLDSNPGVAMVFCEPEWIDQSGRPIRYGSPGTRFVPTRFGVRKLEPGQPVTPFAALFFWGRVSPSISLIRRQSYVDSGGFLEEQGYYGEDLDLFLRIALRQVVHYLPQRLVLRRIHPLNHGSRARVADQELRLYRRWLDSDRLTPQEQTFVRRTWRLRQARLLPMLWRMWGHEHLRRGDMAGAARCYLRSGKRMATSFGARLRGTLPSGPVW